MNVTLNALLVSRPDIGVASVSASFQRPSRIDHHVPQGLDIVSKDCAPTHHHFETVVIPRVMASCDLNSTGAQRIRRKVQHRRRHHAHINDLDAGFF